MSLPYVLIYIKLMYMKLWRLYVNPTVIVSDIVFIWLIDHIYDAILQTALLACKIKIEYENKPFYKELWLILREKSHILTIYASRESFIHSTLRTKDWGEKMVFRTYSIYRKAGLVLLRFLADRYSRGQEFW